MPRSLPNAISVLRLLLVPVWVCTAEAGRGDACLGILVALGFSDVLDGWLARRFELQSRVGATLDAVADKLAQVALFTWLALRGGAAFAPVPLWFLGVLVARDVALGIGYVVIRARMGAVDTEHASHGKAASLLLFGLLVWAHLDVGRRALALALGPLAGFVALSTALYVRDGFAQLRR